MIKEFFLEIKKRDQPLYWFGWINVILLAFGLIMFFVDDTIITGINAWIKPMKFAMSITIYCWTFAWLMGYIEDQGKRRFISWGVIACMFIENFLIFLQAGRGVRSHFNVTSMLNGIIFNIMGLAILVNSFIIIYVIVIFFSNKVKGTPPELWAWRAGLILFFLGGISGGIMAATLTHTVGAVDGGPGLPLLNWSTVAGDIRSAHFITLHGLQAIPLAALVITRLSKEKATTLVISFSIIYLAFCLWLHWIAFKGVPVISLG